MTNLSSRHYSFDTEFFACQDCGSNITVRYLSHIAEKERQCPVRCHRCMADKWRKQQIAFREALMAGLHGLVQ